MGMPSWSIEERIYFAREILPRSVYSTGKRVANSGLGFDVLGPIMQEEMEKRGINNRKYTTHCLFQHWYQKLSPRAYERQEHDREVTVTYPCVLKNPSGIQSYGNQKRAADVDATRKQNTSSRRNVAKSLPGSAYPEINSNGRTQPGRKIGFSPSYASSGHLQKPMKFGGGRDENMYYQYQDQTMELDYQHHTESRISPHYQLGAGPSQRFHPGSDHMLGLHAPGFPGSPFPTSAHSLTAIAGTLSRQKRQRDGFYSLDYESYSFRDLQERAATHGVFIGRKYLENNSEDDDRDSATKEGAQTLLDFSRVGVVGPNKKKKLLESADHVEDSNESKSFGGSYIGAEQEVVGSSTGAAGDYAENGIHEKSFMVTCGKNRMHGGNIQNGNTLDMHHDSRLNDILYGTSSGSRSMTIEQNHHSYQIGSRFQSRKGTSASQTYQNISRNPYTYKLEIANRVFDPRQHDLSHRYRKKDDMGKSITCEMPEPNAAELLLFDGTGDLSEDISAFITEKTRLAIENGAKKIATAPQPVSVASSSKNESSSSKADSAMEVDPMAKKEMSSLLEGAKKAARKSPVQIIEREPGSSENKGLIANGESTNDRLEDIVTEEPESVLEQGGPVDREGAQEMIPQQAV